MKKSKTIILTIFGFLIIKGTRAQFIDANLLFKPRFALETEYIIPQSINNINGYSTNASLLLPIKNKFDIGTSVKDLLKSKSIKEALNKTNPSFSQHFLRMEGGYQELYTTPYSIIKTNQIKIGITGLKVSASLKNKKFKTTLYSVNAGVFESFDGYTTPSIYANAMLGSAKVINLKSLFFYGGYISYYDGEFLGMPILGYLGKITPKLTFTAILPSQTKFTYKFTSKLKQDFIFGLSTQNFGDYNSQNTERLSLRNNNLYTSTQSRIKFSNKINLYLEGGYKFKRSLLEKEGYTTIKTYIPNSGFYAKGTLIFNFNKALLNSGVFDLDI